MEMRVTPETGQVLGKLLLDDFDHFTALIVAAVRAGAMGQLGLVALRALGDAGDLQVVMRAARCRTLRRMATLRVRHSKFLSR